ncbi:MAG: hypothetical protein K0R63_2 [Rickettsiales bacterium]|jgi:hypothetical protein|nr:hypothetical protein [Rickettsiales bacterium]
MKTIIRLTILLLLTSCTIYRAVPVPGETRQDTKGKIITANEAIINAKVEMKHNGTPCPNFKDYKILDTKFIKDSTPAERTAMHITDDLPAWEEDWIIEACGKKWRVPVFFYGDVISTSGAYPLK